MHPSHIDSALYQSFYYSNTELATALAEEDLGASGVSDDSFSVGAKQRRVVTAVHIQARGGAISDVILRASNSGTKIFQWRAPNNTEWDFRGLHLKGAVGDEITIETTGNPGSPQQTNIIIQTKIISSVGS